MKHPITMAFMYLLIAINAQAQVSTVVSGKDFLDKLKKSEEKQASGKAGLNDFKEIFSAPVEAGETQLEQIGNINWTQGVVEAKGKVFVNPEHVNRMGIEYARELALVGAEADARANLLAMIAEVKIFDTVRVVDKMLEKKVTVSILEGSIMARRVGEPTYGNNWVEVTMRCDLEGMGGVREFARKNGMYPQQEQNRDLAMQQEELRKQKEALDWLLKEYKKSGILPDTATTVPPLVLEIPKGQAGQYRPGLLPTVKIKCAKGEVNMDLSKYFNVDDPKALAIVNASRELLGATGITTNVPILDGYIRNGDIEVDACKIMTDAKKDERRKKIAEGFKKFGNVMLQVISIVAAFV